MFGMENQPFRHAPRDLLSTAQLEADAALDPLVDVGRWWTYPNVARQLLALDTVERRVRAVEEAHIRVSLMGGTCGMALLNVVPQLLCMIAEGHENGQMWGEETTRCPTGHSVTQPEVSERGGSCGLDASISPEPPQ